MIAGLVYGCPNWQFTLIPGEGRGVIFLPQLDLIDMLYKHMHCITVGICSGALLMKMDNI